MAKFYGAIGYATTEKTSPGVHKVVITERYYFGDVVKNNRRLQSSEYVNDDVTVSNLISIVADPYAIQNFHAIRYAEFMGAKWKVTTVEEQFPRLLLTLGGLYTNG
jgi:hypothetical protein